ncbi:MAG: hypothetical protein ACRDL5_03005 [Solirubrobacteraceae bacterium]
MLAAGAAAVTLGWLAAGCGAARPRAAATSYSIPHALLAAERPIGRGPQFHPTAVGRPLGPCRPRLGARIEAHVEVFAANRVVIVAAGIGTRPPRAWSAGRLIRAGCYGGLVTLDPTGVVLVRPGSGLRLSDLFRSWGQVLSTRRIGAFGAAPGAHVTAFVNGRRWRGTPGRIPLAEHAEIVVEVGPHVPPHASFTFAPIHGA